MHGHLLQADGEVADATTDSVTRTVSNRLNEVMKQLTIIAPQFS